MQHYLPLRQYYEIPCSSDKKPTDLPTIYLRESLKEAFLGLAAFFDRRKLFPKPSYRIAVTGGGVARLRGVSDVGWCGG